MSRCTGHCCRRFAVSYSPEAIRVLFGREEGAFVADMLVPLPEGIPWYTCKHYDTATNDCTVYERRPEMCRRYGTDENPCEHPGCTKADRAELVQIGQITMTLEVEET